MPKRPHKNPRKVTQLSNPQYVSRVQSGPMLVEPLPSELQVWGHNRLPLSAPMGWQWHMAIAMVIRPPGQYCSPGPAPGCLHTHRPARSHRRDRGKCSLDRPGGRLPRPVVQVEGVHPFMGNGCPVEATTWFGRKFQRKSSFGVFLSVKNSISCGSHRPKQAGCDETRPG